VADFCTAFHMKVLAFNRSPISAPDVKQVELDTLYMQSDIVSIHLPLYEETRHMVSADAFAKMKSDALLINTSRGGIINENALVKALKQHEIGGACLDVYEQEPLPGSSPLRLMKNVLLTPHTAGLPDGVKYHRKRYAFFASQIEKICAGKQPENLLT
jgi:phosphoglycerate dehydrogenase-like enzyme